MRDLRDPEKVGTAYVAARKRGADIGEAVNVRVDDYEDGPYMSSDPADHHSKTPQNIPQGEPGGD